METIDKNKGKRCPGEDDCRRPPFTQERRRAAREGCEPNTEAVCAACPLFKTKPGSEPPHLVWALNLASELHELADMKVLQLVYRNGLAPREVAVMRGAHRGRLRHEEARELRREEAREAKERADKANQQSLSRER